MQTRKYDWGMIVTANGKRYTFKTNDPEPEYIMAARAYLGMKTYEEFKEFGSKPVWKECRKVFNNLVRLTSPEEAKEYITKTLSSR